MKTMELPGGRVGIVGPGKVPLADAGDSDIIDAPRTNFATMTAVGGLSPLPQKDIPMGFVYAGRAKPEPVADGQYRHVYYFLPRA